MFVAIYSGCKPKQRTTHAEEDANGTRQQQTERAEIIDQLTSPEALRDSHYHDFDPMKTRELLRNINDFSFSFFSLLSKEKSNENLAFSPASLNMALAIVYSGARGTTQEQMSRTIGFDYDRETFHGNYVHFLSEMMNLANDTLVDFNLANRVFLEQSYDITSTFISDVSTYHAGAFEKMDFRMQTRLAEQRISNWVAKQTRERIQNIIPSGSLDDLTRLVLVNALYIKSDWKHPFDKTLTREKEFTALGGEKVMKDFMHQRQNRIPWYEEDAFIAIALPYSSPDFSLLMIRPNQEVVSSAAQVIPDVETYQRIIENLNNQDVVMEIPVFQTESTLALSHILRDSGMEYAFDQRADFSGISGEQDLHISNVLQKVFFEIDEEGSEAAAATAITIVTTSAPAFPQDLEPKEFIADRPFVFILKENRFHTPLFIGQYVK